MSEQLTLCSASHSDESAVQSTLSTVTTLVDAITTPRQTQARAVIRHVMRDYSVVELATFGWSQNDIRRLKSI